MILTLLTTINILFTLSFIAIIVYALVGSSKSKKGTTKIVPKIKKFITNNL